MSNELERIPENNNNRCSVCKQDYAIKSAINRMLAMGEPAQGIFSVLNDWPVESFRNKKVPGIPAIINHAKNHLPFRQNAYKKILEKRAAEQGIIIEEGTESYLTNLGMAEVIARKGFEDIVDGKQAPTVKETLEAIKLSAQFDQDMTNAFDAVQAMAQIQRIMSAIQKHVPQAYLDLVLDELSREPMQETLVVDEADSWYEQD